MTNRNQATIEQDIRANLETTAGVFHVPIRQLQGLIDEWITTTGNSETMQQTQNGVLGPQTIGNVLTIYDQTNQNHRLASIGDTYLPGLQEKGGEAFKTAHDSAVQSFIAARQAVPDTAHKLLTQETLTTTEAIALQTALQARGLLISSAENPADGKIDGPESAQAMANYLLKNPDVIAEINPSLLRDVLKYGHAKSEIYDDLKTSIQEIKEIIAKNPHSIADNARDAISQGLAANAKAYMDALGINPRTPGELLIFDGRSDTKAYQAAIAELNENFPREDGQSPKQQFKQAATNQLDTDRTTSPDVNTPILVKPNLPLSGQ